VKSPARGRVQPDAIAEHHEFSARLECPHGRFQDAILKGVGETHPRQPADDDVQALDPLAPNQLVHDLRALFVQLQVRQSLAADLRQVRAPLDREELGSRLDPRQQFLGDDARTRAVLDQRVDLREVDLVRDALGQTGRACRDRAHPPRVRDELGQELGVRRQRSRNARSPGFDHPVAVCPSVGMCLRTGMTVEVRAVRMRIAR